MWISRLFLLVYPLPKNGQLGERAMQAWNTWVLGNSRDGRGSIRDQLHSQIAVQWSNETAEAFINDFFK